MSFDRQAAANHGSGYSIRLEPQTIPGQKKPGTVSISFYSHASQRLSGTRRELLSRLCEGKPHRCEATLSSIIDDEIRLLIDEGRQLPSSSLKESLAQRSMHSFRLRPSSTFSLLEALSSFFPLMWQGTRVIFDSLSTPIELCCRIDGQSAELFLKTKEGCTPLPDKKAGWIAALPNLIVHGACIQRLNEDLSWRDLIPFLSGRSVAALSEKELHSWLDSIDASSSLQIEKEAAAAEGPLPQQQADPIPEIRFHDTRGSLVSLFMQHQLPGEPAARSLPFFPDSGTNSAAERAFEEDLLSTGFERTTFDDGKSVSFRYFCPTEKRDEALQFLLEIGWKLLDKRLKPVLLLEQLTFDLKKESPSYSSVSITASRQGALLKDWNGLRFLQALSEMKEKNSPIASLDAYTLFLPLQSLSTIVSVAQEIEVAASGQMCIASSKKGLFNSDQGAAPHLKIVSEEILPDVPMDLKLFQGQLRSYQLEGVQWLYQKSLAGESAILADEMGLGKTVQVLGWIAASQQAQKGAQTILLIAPKALLFNWQREIERFLPAAQICLFQGSEKDSALLQFLQNNQAEAKIVICSYQTARSASSVLKEIQFSAIIIDEAQTIKNSESQSFQAISLIPHQSMIMLTGTPLENSVKDIWSLFSLIDPKILGPKEPFLKPFADTRSSIAAAALRRTRQLIEPFVLRRTKKMVAKDLPAIIEEEIFVRMEPEEKSRYMAFLHHLKNGSLYKSFLHEPSSRHRMEILEAIMRLRQMTCHQTLFHFESEAPAEPPAKWNAFFEDLETLIEEKKKVLIFSHFSSMIDRIASEATSVRGWKGVVYHGGVKQQHAIETAVDAFQNDPDTSFFATTMKSGGTGLNLTRADAVLIYDPWWNRAVEEQAIGRAHRIGRGDPVVVKRYITHETIEERVYSIGLKKKTLFDALFHASEQEEAPTHPSFDLYLHDLFAEELSR